MLTLRDWLLLLLNYASFVMATVVKSEYSKPNQAVGICCYQQRSWQRHRYNVVAAAVNLSESTFNLPQSLTHSQLFSSRSTSPCSMWVALNVFLMNLSVLPEMILITSQKHLMLGVLPVYNKIISIFIVVALKKLYSQALIQTPRFGGKQQTLQEYARGLGSMPPAGSRHRAPGQVWGQSPQNMKALCCISS